MSSVTIRDVAKKAGVGVATVSRVINGSQNVSLKTRERVLRAIEALNYVPNVAARQLSGGKTQVIGIVTPYLTLPSFSERLAGIQRVLWDSKYDLVLHSVRSPDNLAGKLETLLQQNRVDGIILLTPPELDDTIWDINPNKPIVVVDSHYLQDRYPTIIIDDERGGRLAAEYLIQHGHTKIGFIGDDLEGIFGITSNKYRFEAFQSMLLEAGLALNNNWFRLGDIGSEIARRHAYEILNQNERPTAIFASSDMKAFNVLNVAQEMGLRIPEDIAVIGFDDIEAAQYMKLTTIRQHLRATGVLAAEIMLAWLMNDQIPEPMIHHQTVEIVQRETA